MHTHSSFYHPCHSMLCIMPPHMIDAIKRAGSEEQSAKAEAIEQQDIAFRMAREVATPQGFIVAPTITAVAAEKPKPKRKVYDSENKTVLQHKLVRKEGEPKHEDPRVNEAYDGAGATYKLYLDVYGRDSLDGRGFELISNVHYGTDYDNAFWDGRQMAYGDGGMIFKPLTGDLAVIGHEFSHGVVEFSGGLIYRDQSGALNEHFADVFGSLTKQYSLKQEACSADWLIGSGLLLPSVSGVALRSMKAPGTAYNDPLIGKDPQPYHMDDFVVTSSDNGGVHINSGIPNHAFYLLAMMLGGYAWEKAGQIWYKTMQEINNPLAKFTDWAELTVEVAIDMCGRGSMEAILTRRAWRLVGIYV